MTVDTLMRAALSGHLRDADKTRTHYVYRCFDAEGQLLYIGCAEDVDQRLYHLTHVCNYGKQPNRALHHMLATTTSEPFADKLTARIAERAAIATEAPLLNKQHNLSRFRRLPAGRYVFTPPVHPITRSAFPELDEDALDAWVDGLVDA